MQRLEFELYFVRIVTTHKGGATSDSEDIRFATRESAIATADKLQTEFDEDCEPRRALVLDVRKVPIAAGGERRSSPNSSQQRRPA
jgi:hypothetical protein